MKAAEGLKFAVSLGFFSGLLVSNLRAGVDELTIAERWSAPLSEVSALALKDNNLYLASDNTQALLRIPRRPGTSCDLDFPASSLLSLTAAAKTKLSRKSQWEGLTFDPAGSAFALKENKNEIYEFAANGDGTRVYSLAPWEGRKNKNKGFEGLILLKQGHMLLAQTRPAALVEYGPQGDPPLGLKPDQLLKEKETFGQRSATVSRELVPLHAWRLDESTGCQPSDLTLDGNGSLLILLKDCSSILQIKQLDPLKESFPTEQTYRFPDEIVHAEGLVTLGPHGFLVAVDQKENKNNLFWLQLKRPSGSEIKK